MDVGYLIVGGALLICVSALMREYYDSRGIYPYQMLAAFFFNLFGFAAVLVGAALSFVRLLNG